MISGQNKKTCLVLTMDILFKIGIFVSVLTVTESNRIIKKIGMRQPPPKIECIVELFIVADFSVYEYFKSKAGNENLLGFPIEEEGELRLKQHINVLLHEIDRRFKTVDDQRLSIRIAFAGLYIIQNSTDSLWVPTGKSRPRLDASRTLTYFRKWMQTTPGLPSHDHAILLTKYDLTQGGSNSVAGLAYVESLCNSNSYSIVEDSESISTITVAVHELAHSFGAQHDGLLNACSSSDNYIMSDTRRVNKNIERNRNNWKFSPCSVTYFKKYITKLASERNNCMASLHGSNTTLPLLEDVRFVTNETHPDQQCRNIEGDASFLCRKFYENDYSTLCGLMYCYVGDNVCSFRLPIDGTSCGNQKVCAAGFCVSSENAPSLSETCPFGDQPGTLSESEDGCSVTVSVQPYVCYQQYYSVRCCQSCENIYTRIIGCEFGDRLERCSSIGHIECLFNSYDCCATCAHYGGTMSKLILPVGGVGGLLLLIIVVSIVLCIRRQHRNKVKDSVSDNVQIDDKHLQSGRPSLTQNLAPSKSARVNLLSAASHVTQASQSKPVDIFSSRGHVHYPLHSVITAELHKLQDLCRFHNHVTSNANNRHFTRGLPSVSNELCKRDSIR